MRYGSPAKATFGIKYILSTRPNGSMRIVPNGKLKLSNIWFLNGKLMSLMAAKPTTCSEYDNVS